MIIYVCSCVDIYVVKNGFDMVYIKIEDLCFEIRDILDR